MLEEILLLFFLFLAVMLVVKVGFGVIKYLVANAVIGLIILWFTNWIGISDVPLTALNLLVVAIGGILGVIALIIVYWF
ncbi:pro-sigmaK processing inhibitor BofA family protein [Thermococcus sp.]|uniref:pro-sigmaK processing inhibitor BofA family protein n=1 Tax=Thermococcus sp. TaxID=35749 RepID=UPI002603CB8C|nr:pro-sigmaK processing inhibitor BofA family protein [Thermococcus sp.]